MMKGTSPVQPLALSLADSRDLAVKIREELARRHMSRQKLADLAKISISTLEKALNGSRPFTLATLIRLETALGIALRPRPERDTGVPVAAAEILGAYSRSAVKWLEGDYLTLRPSFAGGDDIYAYRITMSWDATQGCLVFAEADRMDAAFAQKGVVSVPNKSGHVYLHTNDDGQFRIAILSRPLIGGEMYGLLATLKVGTGSQLTPVATALALIPLHKTNASFGRLMPGDVPYAACRDHLEKVTQGGFASLLAFPERPGCPR